MGALREDTGTCLYQILHDLHRRTPTNTVSLLGELEIQTARPTVRVFHVCVGYNNATAERFKEPAWIRKRRRIVGTLP